MNYDEMYDVYAKTSGHKEFDVETLISFEKLLKKRLKGIPVIYKMFQQYSPSDRRKFVFDLKINDMDIAKLNIIINLKYDPRLYREFFLHSFFDFRDKESFLGYGLRCMRMEKNVFGWERVIADSEYARVYHLDQKEYAWVDIRLLLIDSFLSRRDMRSEIMWYGARCGDKLKSMLKMKLENNTFFNEVINWIDNEAKVKKIREDIEKAKTESSKVDLEKGIDVWLNVDPSILGTQPLIDITAARDFWCAFLIEQSKIEFMCEEYEKGKNGIWIKSDVDLLATKETMEEAYQTAFGEIKPKDFAMRMKYAQQQMRLTGMNTIAQKEALHQPVWWLLGDNICKKKDSVIELQRDVYRDDVSYPRREKTSYSTNSIRKKIVDRWDDANTLHDRAVKMEALSIKAHVNDMYVRFNKSQVDQYFDVYIWLYKVTSYLLLLYDEMEFYSSFCELKRICGETIRDLEDSIEKGKKK